ncbi:MAG: immunoglobulin-like domain-containing protein, partial [Clostridiaceae bacterium]
MYRKFFSKPVISLNGKSEINIEVFESYSEEGATAKLNSKDISDRIKIKGEVNTDQVGTYKIEYTVNNRNKEYSITRSVNVIDTVSPKIELKGSEKLTLNTESTYAEPGYRAEDNYDGDITSSVAVTGEVDTKKPGTYTLTYEVTDKSGNTASAVREVTVTLAPKATGGRIYLTFDDGPSSKVTPRILDILKA